MQSPTKPFYVYILWGEESDQHGEANIHLYQFDHQVELDAFLLGVEEAYGFSAYEKLSTLEDAEKRRQEIEPPNEPNEPVVRPDWANVISLDADTAIMFDKPREIQIGGDGLWLTEESPQVISVIGLLVNYYDDDTYNYGELLVLFDTEKWDVQRHGLVYTDSDALEGIHAILRELGISGHAGYSEQGMQQPDAISLDCDGEVMRTYAKCYSDHIAAKESGKPTSHATDTYQEESEHHDSPPDNSTDRLQREEASGSGRSVPHA